jgi:hypothetical protein
MKLVLSELVDVSAADWLNCDALDGVSNRSAQEHCGN